MGEAVGEHPDPTSQRCSASAKKLSREIGNIVVVWSRTALRRAEPKVCSLWLPAEMTEGVRFMKKRPPCPVGSGIASPASAYNDE